MSAVIVGDDGVHRTTHESLFLLALRAEYTGFSSQDKFQSRIALVSCFIPNFELSIQPQAQRAEVVSRW